MSDIIDLDELVPADKYATLAGAKYRLPGDMPLVTFLKVSKIENLGEDADPQEAMLEMVDALVELFAWNLPTHDTEAREKLREQLMRLGLDTLVSLLGKLYSPKEAPADEVAAETVDPPTPPAS
jgi:hypothetical protein